MENSANDMSKLLVYINNQYILFIEKLVIFRWIFDILAVIYLPIIIKYCGEQLKLTENGELNPMGWLFIFIIYIPWAYFKAIQAIYEIKIRNNNQIVLLENSNKNLTNLVRSYKLFNSVIENFNEANLKSFDEYIRTENQNPNYANFINTFLPKNAFNELCKSIQKFIMDMVEVTHTNNVKVGILRKNEISNLWEWLIGLPNIHSSKQLNKEGSAIYKILHSDTDLFIESKTKAYDEKNYELDADDDWQKSRDKKLIGTILYKRIYNIYRGEILFEYMLVINTYAVEINSDSNMVFLKEIFDLISKQILIFADIDYANTNFNKIYLKAETNK